MKHYVSPDVETRDFESEAPLAVSGGNEGFGTKPGFYELLKPFVILLFAGLLASCDPDTQTGRLGSGFTATLIVLSHHTALFQDAIEGLRHLVVTAYQGRVDLAETEL